MFNRFIKRSWRWVNIILSCLFIIMICLPLADTVFDLDPTGSKKAPEETPIPEFKFTFEGIKNFPEKYESYFGKTFGFRRTLIKWYNLAKLRILHSQESGDVIIGEEGWLYYKGDHSLDYYRGVLPPYTKRELKLWGRLFQSRQDWLTEHGIRYLVVFAPNKNTIYPEYMPSGLNKVREESRLDQLVEYLGKNTSVEFLDLREILKIGKKYGATYFKTDTHWSLLGRYIAYRAIMEQVGKMIPLIIPPLGKKEIKIKELTIPGGDLAVMLGLRDSISEEILHISSRKLYQVKKYDNSDIFGSVNWGATPPATSYKMIKDRENLPVLMMVGDSFGVNMASLLYLHFKKSHFIWHFFNHDIIKKTKPDVVINQIVERYLNVNIAIRPEVMEDLYSEIKPDPIHISKDK